MGMKNKSGDLANILFEQLEKLNDDDLKGEALKTEVNRAKAMAGLSREITETRRLQFEATKFIARNTGFGEDLKVITGASVVQPRAPVASVEGTVTPRLARTSDRDKPVVRSDSQVAAAVSGTA